jgi:hypothetical protein
VVLFSLFFLGFYASVFLLVQHLMAAIQPAASWPNISADQIVTADSSTGFASSAHNRRMTHLPQPNSSIHIRSIAAKLPGSLVRTIHSAGQEKRN